MEVIESVKRNKAYQKCKLIVKTWEKEFKTKYGRTPSKYDIKEAPDKIKYAYKKYFQLKSAALENSLIDCDFDQEQDSIYSPDPVQPLDCLMSNNLSPSSEQIMQTLPSGQELEQLLINAKTKETSFKSNQSKDTQVTQSKESVVVKPLSPFTNKLSQKLFENRKFSMRNPRKFSMNKSQVSDANDSIASNILETSSNNSELLIAGEEKMFTFLGSSTKDPDCTNVLNEYGQRNRNINIDTKSSTLRHLNEGWLERVAGVSCPDSLQAPVRESFGINNIKVPIQEKNCDYVENSESESEGISNRLKPALKKRKIMPESQSKVACTATDNSNMSPNKPLKSSKQAKKRVPKNKSKDEDQPPPDITEFVPFGVEKDIIVPRHYNVSGILKEINHKELTKLVHVNNEIHESDKLEMKLKNGTINDNFVKINIEKKVFVRGRKNMNFSKYKKKLNKDKKALHAGMEFPESGKILCFKCGLGGHMARYCTAHRGDTLLPLTNNEDDDKEVMPTLEQMEKIVADNLDPNIPNADQNMLVYKPTSVPESFLKMIADSSSINNSDSLEVNPIFSHFGGEIPSEVTEALNLFGHKSFRMGQEKAIMRILCGMSTLLVLSTGGGKSLCYQIPAYIYSQHYKCITLVISPLVSLMEDQVLSMPDFLRAGCLHTNQPPTQRQKIIQCIKDGELNILLISPEALISGDSSGFSGLFKHLPPIAFACIDEAHCVSQWSHNFRPSYLMICRVLREKLNIKCILGLTATASQCTIKSVIDHLNVPDGLSGVITNPTLPDNLVLSVSLEKDKDRALISLLTSETISMYNSIIVYCIRRDECERVAAILRSSLQEVGKQSMEARSKKRKRMSYNAETYHAGLSGAQRKKIQKHFMDGTLRIIVATVAFGMGINKPDIRCIIHYNMPSSFESYVQEVGRAGRDGKPAYCHAFISQNTNDKSELLKHIHSNTIDRSLIRKLLQKVFIPCECNKNNKTEIMPNNSAISRCKGHEVGIPIDETVEELDLPSENIATLLCYLELHNKKFVKVLNNAYITCKIISYGGPQKILEAAKTCQPLAMAYVLENKKRSGVLSNNIFEFQVIETAAAIGWESGLVKYNLKNLEWLTEAGKSRRSQLKVEFNTLGFKIKAPGDLTPAELDSMLDDLHECVVSQEKTMLYQLEEISNTFKTIGNYSIENKQVSRDDEFIIEKSNVLKKVINQYFERESNMDSTLTLEKRPLDEERVIADARALIVSYKDCTFTGRSIARIFQGISSPNYPALVWGRCRFWRAHINEDFYGLVKLATQQIIQMK